MDVLFVLAGFPAGVVATVPMLLAEIPMWRRFGVRGVFEWDEIRHATRRGSLAPARSWAIVLSLHFVAGGVAGVLFGSVVALLSLDVLLTVQGLGLGVLMWLITLGIHGPVTGVRPWGNDMGTSPVIASLAGHLLFGVSLGVLMMWA